MKRAIIIHGWGVNPLGGFYAREQALLEKRGYKVDAPQMPHIILPVMKEWVEEVKKLKPDENTVIICHSLGTPTVLRYLEEMPGKVDKVILLSAFASDLGNNFEAVKAFVDAPFNWDAIKEKANNFYVIAQKDDIIVPVKFSREVAKKLGVKAEIIEGDDHFRTVNLDVINHHLY